MRGRPHVLYFFRTTCPFCESQRAHVGQLLTGLGPAVITMSSEPSAITQRYWSDVGVKLDRPGMIHPILAAELSQVPGVPTLLFLDSGAHVTRALTGRVLDWNTDSMTTAIRGQ